MLASLLQRRWFLPLLLCLLWIGAAIVVYPYAPLPYGDEFAYIKPVESFLNTGKIHYTDWSSMTLVLQVWIGAAFSWLFGFSFSSLRMVATLGGMSAILALYACLRRIGAEKITAFFITLFLAFNPMFFLMGLLFFTDVPFLGIVLWSLFYFIDFFYSERLRSYILGLLLCMAAFFIRDVAIILPPAFALAYLLKHGINKRSIMLGALPVVALACCYLGWRWWLITIHGLPKNIDFSRSMLMNTISSPSLLASAVSRNIVYTLGYFGTYLLPLLPFVWLVARRFFSKKQWLAWATGGSILVGLALSLWRLHKYLLGHIWDGTNIYVHFDNVYTLSNESVPPVPPWGIEASVLIALLSGSLIAIVLIAFILRHLRQWKLRSTQKALMVFFSLSLFLYCGLMFTQWMITRYYLVMLPFLLLLLYMAWREGTLSVGRIHKSLSVALTVCLLYIALSLGHDIFSRKRASAEAFHYLESELKIRPHDIDGGIDYNTWTNYYFEYKPTKEKNWWWVENPRYVVADGRIENMQLLKTFSYTRWYFPGYEGVIYVHRNTQLP